MQYTLRIYITNYVTKYYYCFLYIYAIIVAIIIWHDKSPSVSSLLLTHLHTYIWIVDFLHVLQTLLVGLSNKKCKRAPKEVAVVRKCLIGALHGHAMHAIMNLPEAYGTSSPSLSHQTNYPSLRIQYQWVYTLYTRHRNDKI